MLNLSRLENSELEKESISVEHLINVSYERVQPKAELKKQKIIIDNKSKKDIRVNQQFMSDALVTILDNAVKYSPEKSEIKIKAKSTSSQVTIEIKDNGMGIKSSELQHIFDRFYRADQSRTKNNEHGFGIGLSIAKSAIEAHGGTITAKSTLGKGSTFTINIPV